jgi:starch phosphorylase
VDPVKEKIAALPERISGLHELAYNLWWSWNPAARMLFKMIDRTAWKESGHNPVKMLLELPEGALFRVSGDREYLSHYDLVIERFHEYLATRICWFSEHVQALPCLPIAYFSAEYGLHHSLPFYAGGLGFLAGDYLKESSDLGVPLVAVGFMYPEGYLKQKIGANGWQEDVDETIERDAAPIERVMTKGGEAMIVRVPCIEPPIYVEVWKVAVGRVALYLIDTDIEMNDPWNRTVSARLYTGNIEHRLKQEIVLGLGGSMVLKGLGVRHSLIHMNEGHSAFALLERIRERVEGGMKFGEAAADVRSTSIFTTHTPVPAGHDVFPFHLMDKYFSVYYPLLGVTHDEFLGLGIHPDAPSAGFNMTAFAMRMSGYRNAVSMRHGEVARRMWKVLWPATEEANVPIHSITNGVHVPTWIEPKIQLLMNRYLDPRWLENHDKQFVWDLVDTVPDEELWKVHYWLKIKLINYIREQARKRWIENRVNPANVLIGGGLLDPMAMTLGFARRFVSYKRADLILQDPERLKRILNDRWRPVQIIFAGKAHPADESGKRILQSIFAIAHDPDLGGRIAFVENYNEQIAQYMVHGVDLWLNNPHPPFEACGTSGMKASLNGVPQLSILDGWWREGFDGKNGWAFEGKDDFQDAESIYRLLEHEIVPLFYDLSENGVPHRWVKVMKESMKKAAPFFSTRRMLKEYATTLYQHALQKEDT